jgi:hypothetical protein
MHLSSIPLLILLLHNKKRYFHYLTFAFLVSLPIFLIVILPIMGNIEALQNSLDKADTYADGMSEVGVFHKLFLMFIIFILFLTFWVYQRQMVHPIIITTFLIYFIAYFINPVMGFRFSPYVILSVLLSNFDSKYKFGNLTKVLNILIIILIPYFIFTFYDTHFI